MPYPSLEWLLSPEGQTYLGQLRRSAQKAKRNLRRPLDSLHKLASLLTDEVYPSPRVLPLPHQCDSGIRTAQVLINNVQRIITHLEAIASYHKLMTRSTR